jgi:ketosteroid isomerase-like protein
MKQILAVAVLASFGFVISGTERVLAQDNEKTAVEAIVRDFEQAVQDYNLAKVRSLLTPDARLIEDSLPSKISDDVVCCEWKAAGIRFALRLHDFETHVQGDVAWVTLSIDGTESAESAEGRELLLRPKPYRECLSQATSVSCEITAVESHVLVKTPSGWKIALSHVTLLPKAQK